jgi:hypothetical protein
MRRSRAVADNRAKPRKHARKTNVVQLKPTAVSRPLTARTLKASGTAERATTTKIAPPTSAEPGPAGFDWTEF